MNTYEAIGKLAKTAIDTDNDAIRLITEQLPFVQELQNEIKELREDNQSLADDGLSQFEDNIRDALSSLRNALAPLNISYQLGKEIEAEVESCLRA